MRMDIDSLHQGNLPIAEQEPARDEVANTDSQGY